MARATLPDPPAPAGGAASRAAGVPPSGAAGDIPRHAPWNSREELLAGRFRFLDRTAPLGWPPDWRAASEELLWRFNLHYHQYLHRLRPAERAELCRHWIRNNPVGTEVAWHPYVVSRRIASWVRDVSREPELLESLWRQGAYLHRTVERHHPGNHLMENARALLLAASLFPGQEEARRWALRGARVLSGALEDQILSDGAHVERSPMYHALVLEGLTDVSRALARWPTKGEEELADLHRRIRALIPGMCAYLRATTHPDGCLALLSDATAEIAPATEELLAYAAGGDSFDLPPASSRFPEAGHYVYRNGGLYLVVDGGRIGPDHLPAHAHADIFTYELDVGRERLVVDSGVFGYAEGEMRDYVRSTAAHNTVTVDGTSQAECWKSFRVARRSAPAGVTFRASDDGCAFEGSFDGYAKLIGDGIRHHRRLVLDDARSELRVEDRVTGEGVHRVTSRIHLHPETTVNRRSDAVEMSRGTVRASVSASGGSMEIGTGWYCPRFGLRREKPVLEIRRRGPLPAELAYTIRYEIP